MIKRVVTIALILVLQLATPVQAFAQAATSSASENIATGSAQVSATTSASLQTSTIPLPVISPTFLLPRHRTPLPVLDTPVPQQTSAGFATPAVVGKLLKKNYLPDEDVTLAIANVQNKSFKVTVLDGQGNQADVQIDHDNSTGKLVYYLSPRSHFRPGKYTVLVTDQQTGQTTQQDFTWGVLAINTNKSIYTPRETADLAMAVLDERGNMVCDAQVTLTVKNSAGNINDTLSTDNGKITVNPACRSHAITLIPDYEAHYQVGISGTYNMTLTAQTKNGTYSIDDSFQVKDSVPFEVERQTATRIYPANTYPVTIKITANQDFSGKITEVVPQDFVISKQSPGQLETHLNASDAAQFLQQANSSSTTAYDTLETIPLVQKGQAVLGAAVGKISMPFTGNFPVTLWFGEHLVDSKEKDLYSRFGLPGHDGIDFGMPIGTPIQAVDDGQIVLASPDGPYGMTVVLQHSWGKSYYGHLSSISAQLNQRVKKRDKIGLSGNSGIVTGPHLHFGIKPDINDPYNGYFGKIDPAIYLGLKVDNSEVLGAATSTLSSNDVQVLTWKVDLKKGDHLTLGYNYKAPAISPQFYTLGPLTFYSNSGQIQFQEARTWQIAVDAAPSSAYANGASTAIGTTSTTLVSKATSFADSNNLIIAVVTIDSTNNTQHTIAAGNLILQNGATTLKSTDLVLKSGNSAPKNFMTYYFVYKDSGATANPTYTVTASADTTGLNAQVSMLILHGIAQSSFTNGTTTTLSTSEKSLGTVTMSAAGDNIILAAVQVDNTSGSGAENIAANALKIKSGASTLKSNAFILNYNSDGTFSRPAYSYLLIYRDPSASANKTYDIRATESSTHLQAQAQILVINGIDSAYEDAGSTSISNGSDTTIGSSLSTTFASGTNEILVSHELDNTTATNPITETAGNQKLKNGSSSTIASSTYDIALANSTNNTQNQSSGLLWEDSGAGASASYSVTDNEGNTGVNGAAKILAFSLAAPSYTQASYRMFQNPSPLTYDVGSALASQNTGVNVTAGSQAFRLRMLVNVANNQLGQSGENFKLQYIDRGTGADCTTAANGNPSSWTDVTNSTAISYNVQSGLSNGTTLTTDANDPTDGGTTVNAETYNDSNNVTNANVWIPNGQDGEWDFSLIDNVNMIDDGTNKYHYQTFCFRVVVADGSSTLTYSNYPSFTAMPSLPTLMRHGKWFSTTGSTSSLQPYSF